MISRGSVLLLAVVVLSATVAVATQINVAPTTLWIFEEKVGQPLEPDNLQAEFHHSTPTVSLTWDAVADAESYHVYRAEGDGHFDQIASVDDPSYDDTDVEIGNTYRYFVTAIPENGLESGPSNEAEAEAVEPTPTDGAKPTATPGEESTPEELQPADPELGPESAGMSSAEAIDAGARWIAENAGASYEVSPGSCNASAGGAHWVVTCAGTLEGCRGSACSRAFRVCVFAAPPTRDWC
jgi:hypothetical protein